MVRRLGSYLRQHHIALLALFVALGGTSYATISLPANSVGSKQLKNKAVTTKKLASSTVKALKGKRGKTGAKGATGAQGPQGIQGVPGKSAGSAWSFASNDTGSGSETAIATSDTEVLSLPGSGIVTTFSAGLVANAVVTVAETATSTVAPDVSCRLQLQGESTQQITQRAVFTGLASGEIKQISLTAATGSLPAGTYDVNVICTKTSTNSNVGFRSGAITVDAVAG